MTLGEKINKLRKSKSISQDVFAEDMKVARQTVAMWELDKFYPEINKLIVIANILDVTLAELLN
ncbi:helix-turn-helix domain-containing protein [Clostridium sp. DL1XJH146]